MSDQAARGELEARVLALLSGELSDEERERLEREILDDDERFEEVSAIEEELLDAYARGALDADTRSALAETLRSSVRMQSKVETSLALTVHASALEEDRAGGSSEPQVATKVDERERQPPTAGFWSVALPIVLLFAFAAALWAGFGLWQQVEELRGENARLETALDAQQERVETLEERQLRLNRRLTELEAELDRP